MNRTQIEKLALKMYEEDEKVREKIFDTATDLYPKYNTISSSDHEEAVLYIKDKLIEALDEKYKLYKLTEDEMDSLRDVLDSMVSGALS